MNVLFRVDGGSALGWGHLVRCRVLADEFRRCGWRVLFAVKEESVVMAKNLLRCADVDILIVPADLSLREECLAVRGMVEERKIRILVADVCHELNMAQGSLLTEALGVLCRRQFCFVIIDDFKISRVPSDVHVVPYYGVDSMIDESLKNSKMLIGLDYFLFSQEFVAGAKSGSVVNDQADRVLVSFGGSDRSACTEMVITSLLRLERKMKITVVAASTLNEVRLSWLHAATLGNEGRIQLVIDSQDMPGLLREADLAVISGGLTKYEAALMGTPAVIISQLPLEAERAEIYAGSKAAVHLGMKDALKSDLGLKVEEILGDYSMRLEMSNKARKLTDGRGAERVFNAIVEEEREHGK